MTHTLVIHKNVTAKRVRQAHALTEYPRRHVRVTSFVLALILSCMLVYAPLSRAFADEGVAVEETVSSVVEPDVADEVVEEQTSESVTEITVQQTDAEDAEAAEEIDEEESVVSEESDVVLVDTFFSPESAVIEVAPVVSTSTPTPVAPPLTQASSTKISTTTESVDIASTTDADSLSPGEVGSGTDEVLPAPEVEMVPDTVGDVATTTDAIDTISASTTPGAVVNAVTNDENRFSFGLNECVSVGDGSFYCTERAAAPLTVNDGAVAETDSEGDVEIYFIDDGARVQITHNTVDDKSPTYDPVSGRIVWHAYVSDRYQIFSYDVRSKVATQLTDTSYNNMEPAAYGDVTLWQAWQDGNWEIMIQENGETKRLTENATHDIAPHIRGDYILWQSYEGTAWRVKVYDRTTGLIDTVEGEAGVSVENPRFVLVYDSKKENGDVETLGYDFDSKRVVPLASTPAPVPEEVPEPEEDGEERALVQQNTPRTETRTEEGGQGGDGDGDDDIASSTQSDVPDTASSTVSVSAFDIVIPAIVADEALNTVTDIASTSIVSDNDEQ